MSEQALPTEFAPAERSSVEELKRQQDSFAALSVPCAVLDAMPHMVVVLNKHRQIVHANKAVADAFGEREVDRFIGLRPGEALGCVHSGDTTGGCGTTKFCSVCGAVKAILSALGGAVSVEECRITGKTPGTAYDFRVWATPFVHEGENFVIYAILDISNEKRRAFLERIFFHDILNTAGGVKGLAEMLGEVNGDDAESCRRMMVSSSGRLIDEINSQKDLSAAERGDLQVKTSQVDAVEFLEHLAALYRAHETAKDRAVAVASSGEMVALKTDRVMLSRVLSNMVKNALEASPKGATVTMGCSQEGASVVFQVHNPGVMPPEVQLQTFQRSFSTKGAGRGLGTYSTKLLGERYLKGKLNFESSEEKGGTTFFARFPLELAP